MVVNLSNEAKVLIQQYKKALLKSPYRCTKERSNELGKEMLDTIVKEASNADSLQICPYTTLGQEKDKDDKPINQNLRWFQYESPSSSVWGVSVMCDFEHDVATVHRIVHSSFIKESSMRWIPLQDFNKQIQEENTMKKLNITRKQYNESRYFQKKYGTLEYVSESGNVYKTSKGETIRLIGEGRYKQINFTKDELLDRIQEYIIKFEEIRNQLDELSEFFYKNVKQPGRDFLRSAEYNSLPMHEQNQVYDTIMNAINTQGTSTLTATAHRSA